MKRSRQRRSRSCFISLITAFLGAVCLGGIVLLVGVGFIPQMASDAFGAPQPDLPLIQRTYLSFQLLMHQDALTLPANPEGQPVQFLIREGETANTVATRLYESGLIRDREVFRAYLIYSGRDTRIRAGSYTLSAAMNALEIAVRTTPPDPDGTIRLTRAVAEESIQQRAVVYDHDEEGHYDTISAFIKSVRGSDPHAAVYWLAKMLYAGEDPRFIARRLIILAAEDIGNADPRGLTLAVAAMQAADFVGMPEARIILAQATTYLATAPKSNASYRAVEAAWEDVRQGRTWEVPEHLKNIHLRVADGARPAEPYRYPHDAEGRVVAQAYGAGTRRYYEPSPEGYEEVIARRMAAWDRRRAEDRAAKEVAP